MVESRLIGIFGGTFDPVHNGHLQSVLSLLDVLSFDQIHLLPSATPPHRLPTRSSAKHRLNMVELAIEGYPQLVADGRECKRQGKSYTIDTLESFRTEFPNDCLAFITGVDAYRDIPNWKQWQDYLDYSHIVVMRRPGHEFESSWGDNFMTDSKAKLRQQTNGLIYFAQTKCVDISSTQIRKKLSAGDSTKTELPEAVLKYIIENKLYANT